MIFIIKSFFKFLFKSIKNTEDFCIYLKQRYIDFEFEVLRILETYFLIFFYDLLPNIFFFFFKNKYFFFFKKFQSFFKKIYYNKIKDDIAFFNFFKNFKKNFFFLKKISFFIKYKTIFKPVFFLNFKNIHTYMFFKKLYNFFYYRLRIIVHTNKSLFLNFYYYDIVFAFITICLFVKINYTIYFFCFEDYKQVLYQRKTFGMARYERTGQQAEFWQLIFTDHYKKYKFNNWYLDFRKVPLDTSFWNLIKEFLLIATFVKNYYYQGFELTNVQLVIIIISFYFIYIYYFIVYYLDDYYFFLKNAFYINAYNFYKAFFYENIEKTIFLIKEHYSDYLLLLANVYYLNTITFLKILVAPFWHTFSSLVYLNHFFFKKNFKRAKISIFFHKKLSINYNKEKVENAKTKYTKKEWEKLKEERLKEKEIEKKIEASKNKIVDFRTGTFIKQESFIVIENILKEKERKIKEYFEYSVKKHNLIVENMDSLYTKNEDKIKKIAIADYDKMVNAKDEHWDFYNFSDKLEHKDNFVPQKTTIDEEEDPKNIKLRILQ